MKNFLLFLPLLLSVAACQKTVEKKAEDIIIRAMVNGQWVVTKFAKGNNDVTADFAGYRFQFRENNTVEALKDGSFTASGSWQGNPYARSIASQFNNAVHPLVLLNGVWLVTNNSWTFVEATQTVNGEAYSLRLDKR